MASGVAPCEDLIVADVFAPQTIENLDDSRDFTSTGEIDQPASLGSGNISTGFLITTEASPTKASRATGPCPGKDGEFASAGISNLKKKLRNKRTQNSRGRQHLLTDSDIVGSPNQLPAITKMNILSGPSTPNGGISALRAQLEAVSLTGSRPPSSNASAVESETETSCASVASDSDQTETYEVHLEHDFVSYDTHVGKVAEDGFTQPEKQSLLCRKMTAEDFEPLTCLGKGTYGTVLLVRHKLTGALYAQKQFQKASLTVHKKLVEQTKTERAILESVNRYPFIVNLYYAFQDHEKLYLILEYAQGGELFTHLAIERMFSEDVAAFYMAELVLALEHLHVNIGVIYRDLKPENCLLDVDGHLLLTDFGLSKVAVDGDDRCNSSLGTVEYMAPEVIQGKPYGKACDWWSLGALGFDLLTGSPPFKGNNNAKISEKILKQKLVVPYFIGPDAKDLLIRLLRKEPHKRLGYHLQKDIKTIKSHRFFRKIDWKALERRELDPPIKPVVTDPALAENFSVDFTGLSLGPIVAKGDFCGRQGKDEDMLSVDSPVGGALPMESVPSYDDPFGGFSFVASSSLLDHEYFGRAYPA
ncbi:hypothetical protein LOZ46_000859 [Ophidiomyces ophidiicola]|nr:hypothetical protein LOZ46_000859 [Ophidiomyces ophidiicola]